MELQLIDPQTLDLQPRSIELLDLCKQRGIDGIKAEFTQSMIEVDSEISIAIKDCRNHLEKRLAKLSAAANELGLLLAVSGTHPFQHWKSDKVYPKPRFGYLLKKFQWLARRLTVYGLHVNIGVESGEQAIAISNQVVQYLPHLLALSTSSPFFEAIDTGLQSSRISVMESIPSSGLPYFFPDWQGFENYCDTLLQVGAIQSLKDIYWFVRPNPIYGTLEFRICDGIPTLSETMAVVALIQALVVWIDEGLKDGSRKRDISMRRYWIAPENNWTAARDGLDGMLIIDEHGQRRKIAEDILLLLEQLQPIARRLNSEEELSYVKQILCQGTSATRQRAVFVQTGRLTSVVKALVQELETDEFIL